MKNQICRLAAPVLALLLAGSSRAIAAPNSSQENPDPSSLDLAAKYGYTDDGNSCVNNAYMDIGSQQQAENFPDLGAPPPNAAAAEQAGWSKLPGADGRPSWVKQEGDHYLYSRGIPYRTVQIDARACASECPPELKQYADSLAGTAEKTELKTLAAASNEADKIGFQTGADLAGLVAGNDSDRERGGPREVVGQAAVPAGEVPLTYDKNREVSARLPLQAANGNGLMFDGSKEAPDHGENSMGKPNMVVTPNASR